MLLRKGIGPTYVLSQLKPHVGSLYISYAPRYSAYATELSTKRKHQQCHCGPEEDFSGFQDQDFVQSNSEWTSDLMLENMLCMGCFAPP